MRKMLAFVAISSLAAAVGAQQSPPPPPGTDQPAQPKMIKKKVCERVDNEETTGSRLGSAPKVCKIVLVPAPAETKEERGR